MEDLNKNCRVCSTKLIVDDNITISCLNKKDWICKSCKKEYKKKYYNINKNKINEIRRINLYLKKCIVCNIKFETNKSNKNTCSILCYKVIRKEQKKAEYEKNKRRYFNYIENKLKTDDLYYLKSNIKSLLN